MSPLFRALKILWCCHVVVSEVSCALFRDLSIAHAPRRQKNHGPIYEVPPLTGSRRTPVNNFSANRDSIMRDRRASIAFGRSNGLAAWVDAAFLRVGRGRRRQARRELQSPELRLGGEVRPQPDAICTYPFAKQPFT
ncbi:hypothetical protein VTK26DRAFT_8604 [Humicola hyalothermophila]